MTPDPHDTIQTRTWLWSGLAATVALMDQAIKWMVHELMPYGQSIPLTSFFNWVHLRNTGAAFSFLADAGGWQRYLFIGLALLVSIVLAMMLRRSLSRFETMGYSLILGGALGNVIDRIARGYVVDYLDFYWRSWHWPAFNLADISLFLGAILLIFVTFRGNRPSVVTA